MILLYNAILPALQKYFFHLCILACFFLKPVLYKWGWQNEREVVCECFSQREREIG